SIVSVIFGTLFLSWGSLLLYRHESRKRQMKHVERLKAFELGQPVPDTEVARANVAGWIGTVVPLVMAGAALVVSNQVLNQARESEVALRHSQTEVLIPIWFFAGVVSLVAVIGSLRNLRRSADGSREAKKGWCHRDRPPVHA